MRHEPKFRDWIEANRPKYLLSSTYGKTGTMASTKKNGRQHKATFSKDKFKGGYCIRVMGPMADRFAGRTVPVEKKNGEESEEKLVAIVWTGTDKDSGAPVALYTFEQKPRDDAPPEF